MDLIHYSSEIDLARLNKKYVREWSFLYDTMLKVFVRRKTWWDQINYIAQYLVHSLAYGRSINVGRLISKELTGRLGKSPAKRGNEIFFPTFIQYVLNFKNDKLIELEEIDTHRIGYNKTMPKVLFGTLDAKNLVEVPLGITSHMREIFEKHPLNKPIYYSLSMEKAHLVEATQIHPTQDEPNPSTTIPLQPFSW